MEEDDKAFEERLKHSSLSDKPERRFIGEVKKKVVEKPEKSKSRRQFEQEKELMTLARQRLTEEDSDDDDEDYEDGEEEDTSFFSQFAGLLVGLASLGIVLAVGFIVVSQAGNQLTVDAIEPSEDSTLYGSIEGLSTLSSTIPTVIPIIVITTIGAVLLGAVGMFRR